MIDAAVPHGTAQRQTVEAGDHHVEDEQVEAVQFGARQSALPVADGLAGVALMAEMEADELADVGLVFDDQDAGIHSKSQVTRLKSQGSLRLET
jgi:hypothetical protein